MASETLPGRPGHARTVILAMGLLACGVVSASADVPTRKAGLWELKIDPANGKTPAQTIQQCTDATTDKDMFTTHNPMSTSSCSQQNTQTTATGLVVDSTCQMGHMTTTSHAEINGDFSSAYTVTVTSKRSGGPAGMPAESVMKMDAKWLGPCKADQKPGDIIMPGGMKMNIADMKAMRAAAPGMGSKMAPMAPGAMMSRSPMSPKP